MPVIDEYGNRFARFGGYNSMRDHHDLAEILWVPQPFLHVLLGDSMDDGSEFGCFVVGEYVNPAWCQLALLH